MSVTIAVHVGFREAVRAVSQTLVELAPEPVLIVPDNRTGSRPNPYATLAVVEGLATRRALSSLALPAATSRTWQQRWRNLATRAGIPVEPLGDEGWVRVALDGMPTTLMSVDVPIELMQSGTVIALSTSATDAGCVSLWNDAVHPNSAMRAQVGGAATVAELALAVDATYLLTGQSGSLRIAALARDRIVAELVAFALYRLREESTGVEAIGPWEERTVQHLIEVGGGVSSAAQVTLSVVGSANTDGHRASIARLAELLGCRIDDKPL